MSDNKIDARGLSCPQPVLLTNKAIKDGAGDFEVLVDSEVSKENVLRCISKNKRTAEVQENGEEFVIRVSK